ncbi:MAG: hypothetical protein Q9203_005582 [Teloschistes exilis]
MSRVPDDEEPLLPRLPRPQPHLPKRKKRHSSLLDVFVSHQQVNKLRADERARKQAEAVEKAEKKKAIAAAVVAIEPAPTAPTAPQEAAPEAAAPQAAAPQGAAPEAAAPQAAAPEAAASQAAAPQAVAPQAVAPQAVAPQAAAPQAVAPQTVAPQAVAPQAVAPQAAAPQASKPEDAAHPAGPQVMTSEAAGKAPWSPADDVALLSLKAQNKTWNEIADILVGRTKNELRLRYKDIGLSQATAGPASTGGIAVNDGQPKNDNQKGQGGKKGKGKQVSMVEGQQGEASALASGPAPGPAPVYQQAIPPTPVYQGRSVGAPVSQQAPASATAAPFVWPRPPTVRLVDHEEAVVVTQRDLRIKGLLRRGEDNEIQFDNVTVPEGATELNGAPIIYLDDYDPLNMDDLSYLYDMKCKFEERIWNWMASKLFDQTGKRIEPEWIKEKLQNCN